ncbi:MAG: hypothetical protein C0506_04900 [Anaerolinea sp.]|nr:hypothetical protein [Anaerolinea sp.]
MWNGAQDAPSNAAARMNWLDIVLLGTIAFVTWRAFANGFIRELVGLSAAFLAIPIAGIFYDDMYPKVHPIVDNDTLASLVSFLAILIGVIIGGQVIGHLLKRTVAMLNLGAADRLAGGLFGFAKIVLIAQVILIALVVFPRPDLQGAIDDSEVATILLDAAPAVLAFLPGNFDQRLDAFLDGVAEVTGPGNQAAPKATPAP